MSDIKFDIMRKSAIEADLATKDSELNKAMQPYIDSGQYSEEQLAEIKKNISNRLKNEKERKKQEEEEKKRSTTPKKEEEEEKPVVKLADGTEVSNHNDLYVNKKPLYNSFRHDATVASIKKGGDDSNFWELEEDDAIGHLREKYSHTDLKFEETEISAVMASYDERKAYEESGGKQGRKHVRRSQDAVKITASDGSFEIIELDIKGFFEPEEGWDAVKIDNYNKLTSFLEAHTAESDKAQTITNDKERAIYLEKVRVEKLEPTEEEYIAQIEEKELTSTDIFNEKKDTQQRGGTLVEVNLEFGGHEEDIEQARKQLIQENRGKAAASNMPYIEPTIEEVKDKALLNLQNAERKYLRTDKYDAYMNELEDFEDWDAEWVLERAEEEGLEKHEIHIPKGKPFRNKIIKEMKSQYYKLKVAGNDEEANAVLKYRANELLLKNSVSKIETSDVYKRFNEVNAMIQNPSAVFAPHENEIELENGKLIPLHIWEQHIKDQVEVQEMMGGFDDIMKQASESISVLEDNSFKWDLIKRNYNDWERTQEVLGYGFGNIGATAIYGVPKFLTFGATGGDEDIIRWKETVAKNRQSFRKDVEWDRAFEDGNFGRFMAQSAVDQIPIYATLMTGNAGLGILGSSVFGDKWAEMTMEDRYKDGAPSPTWEKWFKSLGYAGSEVVLDYAITVPIMRNARNMMRGGKGKAMMDNSMNAFFKNNASKALVFSPALEGISEGATQFTQNMIDGRPVLENIDHAAFLGLTMGVGMSYTGFTGGLITSQFSDHKSLQEVRDNMTEMQKLFEINRDIKEGLKFGLPTADRVNAKQRKKDNEVRIQELINQNDNIINKVNNNIKEKISPKAYREFLANELRAETIKVEAQKILDSGLDKKTQDKRLKELLVYFDASNSAAQHFKDPKAFGSRWTFVTNATSKEGKENLERLKDLARTELQKEGKQEPDDKKVLERARYVWAKEQARESNESYKRTNLAKDYTSFETIDEAVAAYDSQIQREIDILSANNEDGSRDNQIKGLEENRKIVIESIKSGDTYGLTHVNIFGESIALSVVESQAKAERFETRTHEGGHQVFWNALESRDANINFTSMAEQVLDWLKRNDAAMYKRVVSLTEKDVDGNLKSHEVISVFLEEVAEGKFDVKKNKGFSNLWGLMANDVITKTTGKDFEFDFAGETDVVNFLVGLGRKIKDGTFTKADERAMRKSELMRSFVTQEKVESVTDKFSQESSDNVQRIYEQQGEAGAFDIIEEFKPITTKIAKRYREVPGYNEELLVSEIELGERGILDLISKYNIESGVPLAAYINTYLPARSIEAANRILEERFTEDITERVDIATEEVEVGVKEKPKRKILLSDRLGVKSKVNKAIKVKLPGLDIENLTFKTLKDQTPEITGEMFGISSKKLVSGANITKKELQSAQMFISKNADVLMSMLPEGATASGTATGVPQTLLKAFYTKTDRAKMAKTGTKAGLAIQIKNDIKKTDFLETFGIIDGKPDRTDRNTSARVLALANQTGKMMTNQAVRQEVEKQGNVSQSIVLKLQDGKSSVMFSKAIPESKHDIYYTKYGDLVAEISNSNNKDLESIKNRVTNTFKDDLTKNEILKVSKEIFKNIEEYGVLEKKHIMPSGRKVIMPQTLQEFLIDKAIGDNLDYGVKEMLKKYLPKDKNGKTIDIGTHYLDKNRINRQRAAIVDLGIEMSKTMPVEEVLETILKYYKGMFVGASKIADGRFIEKNGVVIKNPNYKPLVPKKGKDGVVKMVPPKNRKQVFQNMQDFIDNFVMKLPGVTNVSTKISKDKKITIDKVTINGKPVSIDSKLLGENSKAALRDMDFKGRKAQALKARKEVERLLDFYFKKMSEKNPSLDAADLGMILTSMGSGMTSIMRRSANFKYMGIGVETSKDPGKDLEYEHMIPQVEMALKVLKSYLENGSIDNSVWEGYHVAIIPKTMDDVLVENKFRSKSPVSGSRYYNMVNFGDKRLVPIKSIDPADNGKIIGEDFITAGNIINGTIKEIQDMGVVSRAYMFSRTVNPAKGITVLDFDDTLATTKSGVRAKIPNSDGLPKPNRKVIFLAGGAGSGKGNVISKLGLEDQGFKIVNSDISLEWLKKNNGLPENMNDFTKEQRSKLGSLQHQARGIAKRKMMKYQGEGGGVIVDGTGGSIKSMENLVNEFKDKGYDVSMVFVETSLDVALERNAARKERSLLDKIVTKNHEAVQGNKDGFKTMFGDRFMEVNTNKLSQEDAMPNKLVKKMNDFVSGYENRRLDAEEFASEGADILEQGGTFDFSEFNKVVGGQTAPLFEKAMKLQEKFGPKDMFVLTARPAVAADAIHAFLTANGLNIPLENITGLENSTPEAKALWIADKVGEGYNDFYFADDALQNVQAVQNMLDQFDVKSKVQQAKVDFVHGDPQVVKLLEESSKNDVKDVDRLTKPGTYGKIMFSKAHRGEYENTIAKYRPDLVKEGLVSKTVDNMFDFINNLGVPTDKKRKYERITTKWLATSNVKLGEDSYKIQQAVELAEKHKEDIFSYRNPNEIIEKYAGKTKAKPTNPKTVKEFGEGRVFNKKHGITVHEVENTVEGQKAVRDIIDTHWGKDSNPWCITQVKDGKLTDDAWHNWTIYDKSKKYIVFQNGKLSSFYANNQYWDRMDSPTDAPVIQVKEGNVTKKVELVPVSDGKVQEYVMETRTVSKDKKTVTTEILHETQDGYEYGTKIIENRVNGITVKSTRSRPGFDKQGNDIMHVQEIINFDKKGKVTGNIHSDPSGNTMAINRQGAPFGEMSVNDIVMTKGDLLSHEIIDGDYHYYHGKVKMNNQVTGKPQVTEIGWKMPENLDLRDVTKTSPNGEVRADLKKILEVDPGAHGIPSERGYTPVRTMFSKGVNLEFNDILENTTGVESIKEFSNAQARLRGQKTKYKSIIPASAQDFQGLLYNFLGKGKQGEADMAFFKKTLIDPFARGINELNASRQSAANDFENLNKNFPDVKKKLNKSIEGLDYTYDQAMRVYLWNKAGFEVPGLSKRDLAALTGIIESNPEMKAYADAIGLISKKDAGYSKPKDYWLAESIASDLLSDGAIGDLRSDLLAEWIENKNMIFSKENLNKIEAIYGSKFREALEDMLYRMETGRNRPTGGSRLVNGYMNWVNNSVGAIMFFNLRSATLQTISATNYVNWTDNNPLKAAAAFANQPQFWKDFAMIYNSDYLKQRRSGNQRGINEAELSEAVAGSDNKAKAALAWLLKKGFTPTQIADSFAISMGGATFLRNRIKTYVKQGMSQKDAEAKAWIDFQETTEVNQQSARPDMISQQQASPLGRLILAFQNTPMQYARIMNKATRDLANGRGDYKTHISKIAYYGFVQAVIFGALQSALYASLGDDDEEDFDKKKERILNQMVDSWLTGIGVGGKAIGTVKNTIMEYLEQRDKGFNSDHAYTLLTLLSFSPPIGSKLRKIYSSIQTEQFNRGVFSKRGFTLDNPIWSGVGNVIEGVTNAPLGRMANLMLQLDNAMDSSHKWWQRVALILGQNTWDLGIKDPDIEAVKSDVKKDKKKKKETTKDIKKETINKKKQAQEKIDGKKNIKCAAVSKSGNRCKTIIEPGSSYCTIHAKVKQRPDGKKVQCKGRRTNKKRCGMQTSNKSGYCYYHD